MNITVYLGAKEGNDPSLHSAARELGTWIGGNGHTLIYGGSKCGLMGVLAESTLMAGGKVIGVEPQFFIDMGFDYDAITQLIVTKNMSERKAKMIELGEAFIAFPGGTGTLEEISEKLYFDYGTELHPDALYSEQLPGGFIQVLVNAAGEESKVNIEAFFNAVHKNKELVKNLLKK